MRRFVTCVARLAPPKDIRVLIDALTQPDLRSWQLRIVGDGPDRAMLEHHCRSRAIEDRVVFLGERRDVPEQLEQADVFVLSSDWEGLPYSILEAMAAALPVIASRVGGVPELVVHGLTGHLVARRNLPELVEALRTTHADGDSSRDRGYAGYKRVRERFPLERMIDQYDELFQALLRGNGTRWKWSRSGLRKVDKRRRPARLPRTLVVVTLTEVGGAQTFVETLVSGLSGSYDFHVAAHGGSGSLEDACSRAGAAFHHLGHLVREPSLLHDPAAVIEIRALVDRLKPDLVQLNSSKAGALVRIALAHGRLPTIYTAHGWAFAGDGVSARLYAGTERLLAPLTDAIVCVSDWDRRLALARGVGRADQLRVIHNGIIAPERPPRRDGWPERPRLVCIARLSPQKDVPLLLEAVARPGLEMWEVDIFGDGPDRKALENRISELRLSGRVRLRGERDDLRDELAEADAFALPSNWEGLPFSILEAMAAGLPVLASEVGGVSEEVIHHETGLLVPRGDVVAFAAALRDLHADGTWARSLGIAGHVRVRSSFGVEKMLERYDALFGSLVAHST